MELSLGPFLTCLMTSLILTIYFFYVLYRKKTFFAQGKRFVFIGVILILLRMAVPLNFPFTYSIYSEHILPTFIGFLYNSTPFHGWSILDILYRIVFIGAVIKLIRLLISKIRLNNYMKEFEAKDTAEYHHLYELASHYTTDNIRIAVLPDTISPAITGLRTPTLLLPDISFTDTELEYVFKHELMHYKKHDLWITLLVDIVCCIHWWNPLIYLLKKEYTLFMEVSNDQAILQNSSRKEHIQYANLIVSTAKAVHYRQCVHHALSMNFIGKSQTNLRTRIKFITTDFVTEKRKNISRFLQSAFITILLIFSFVFVTELAFPVLNEELGTGILTITQDNGFFIHKKNSSTYDLYVDGKYLTTLDHIPEEMTDFQIKEQ